MPFPGYKIYEEYNPEQYKTSVQKKVERVLGEAEKEQKSRPESSAEFQEVMEREAEKLREFFGYDVEVPAIPEEVTPERYERWKEMGFELHYLPDEELAEDRDLPGWKKKPGKRYTDRATQEGGKAVDQGPEFNEGLKPAGIFIP